MSAREGRSIGIILESGDTADLYRTACARCDWHTEWDVLPALAIEDARRHAMIKDHPVSIELLPRRAGGPEA